MGEIVAQPDDEPIVENSDETEDIPVDEGAETEVEIVRSGNEGSQPDKQHGIRKRINRLNARREDAESTAAATSVELATERDKNKLLTLALEQKQSSESPPDPVDFDDGIGDPRYAEAMRKFNKPAIDAAVQEATKGLTQEVPVKPNLERNQVLHYERAAKLGAKDFDEVEEVAIKALGSENATHLIENSERSELVLYYFGKHPDEAEDMKALILTNPIKAMLQLGRLEAELSMKPKANVEPAPDPDAELQGGTPSAGKTNTFQRRLDKARELAGETSKMGEILAIKRAAKEAGATVI